MQTYPFISVILPIRNESTFIERCLSAILAQDYPADRMEILIADGMSTDETRKRIQALTDSLTGRRPSLVVFDNPGKIVPIGLNLALRRARGEVIVRVDGHTVIAPDYVRCCVEVLQRTDADNVGGKMDAVGEGAFGEAVALATSTPFGVGGARFHYSDREEWVDTVYMGAWPRRVFEKIGLFDEELVRDQDDEFNYRLREQGGRILLSPAIRSEYTVRSTTRTLWRQYFQYGYWKVRVLQKHPRQMRLGQFAPPVFVFSLLAGLFLLLFPFPYFPLHPSLFIPTVYLAVNLIASTLAAMRIPSPISNMPIFQFPIPHPLFLLPLIYTILHISYGLGFLAGLFRFLNRWNDKIGKSPHWSGDTVR